MCIIILHLGKYQCPFFNKISYQIWLFCRTRRIPTFCVPQHHRNSLFWRHLDRFHPQYHHDCPALHEYRSKTELNCNFKRSGPFFNRWWPLDENRGYENKSSASEEQRIEDGRGKTHRFTGRNVTFVMSCHLGSFVFRRYGIFFTVDNITVKRIFHIRCVVIATEQFLKNTEI